MNGDVDSSLCHDFDLQEVRFLLQPDSLEISSGLSVQVRRDGSGDIKLHRAYFVCFEIMLHIFFLHLEYKKAVFVLFKISKVAIP